jgi:glycosyltransferase involved in cell wall biosynthesis
MIHTYQAFDLLVQSSDYEGTPTVIVEAMALGIPVVATDVGGTAQLCTDQEHGLLVPRRDPAAICQAVEMTLDDPRTEQRRVAARQRVEKEFSFACRTRRLERIYTQLVRWGHLSRQRLEQEESCCDEDPVSV